LSNQEVYFFVPKSEFPDVETWTEYVVEQANAGTPITTYYILNEPIETALSEEEIAAFKALHTNYPNTTVLNDAGATMELSYNADTKTYVDNNSGAVSDEQIESVVENYLEENPIDVPDVDLSEYVKNTDYAAVGVYGLVKTASHNDDGIYLQNGIMSLTPATNSNIDARKTKRPIVPTNLNYAVKVGLTTNTIELTDDEKTEACNWMGAVEKMGEGTGWRVYGVYADGSSWEVPIVNAAKEATLPWRGVRGTVIVGTPEADDHATNKSYVDSLVGSIESALDSIIAIQNSLIGGDGA
jgi:hypothetical protein